jgi:DNA-binding response OmpR family regulator
MSKKIMILDDDSDILEILTLILSDAGYEVRALENGETIKEQIGDFQPDLLMMDVMLGAMDGRIICSKIKNDPSTANLPIILISGTHDLAQSLDQPGAPDDFVAKPFDMQQLLARIARQLY